MYAVLDSFAKHHDTGAGVFVIGHSLGLMVALHLAADPRGGDLLAWTGRVPSIGTRRSFGWAARPYHLTALAFAAQCILRRALPAG